jgi:Cys-rich four helix bundle protein (predicted Tat secretion target)
MSDRREFLQTVGVSLGAMGAAQLASGLVAGTAEAADKPRDPSAAPVDIRVTTADCIRAGEGCVGHCIKELASGNTKMADCNVRVHDMLAMVQTMLALSSYDSALAKRVAPICADACKACADACLEHQAHWEHGMHLACKDCYQACLNCEKACRALAS